MFDPNGIAVLSGAAYRLFYEELLKHLHFAISSLENVSTFSPDLLQNIGQQFHIVRGSAGFFQLSEVATIAAALEQLPKQTEIYDQRELFDRARELVTAMASHIDQLPNPLLNRSL